MRLSPPSLAPPLLRPPSVSPAAPAATAAPVVEWGGTPKPLSRRSINRIVAPRVFPCPYRRRRIYNLRRRRKKEGEGGYNLY